MSAPAISAVTIAEILGRGPCWAVGHEEYAGAVAGCSDLEEVPAGVDDGDKFTHLCRYADGPLLSWWEGCAGVEFVVGMWLWRDVVW